MAYANGYTYRRTVTIDHTKVEGSADLTNYPVLIKGTYTYLKTTANSGKVQSATGYDIIFTSDEAGSTVLDFERVSWSATTGAVVFYVEVPTVDYDANTEFTLTGSINSDLSDYYDASNWVSCRVLQDIGETGGGM